MSGVDIKEVVKEKYGQAALRVSGGGSSCCGATPGSGSGSASPRPGDPPTEAMSPPCTASSGTPRRRSRSATTWASRVLPRPLPAELLQDEEQPRAGGLRRALATAAGRQQKLAAEPARQLELADHVATGQVCVAADGQVNRENSHTP